ncbi:MPN499 family protein [Mycoplasmopsis agassizii]|uniref:MPN499 family protein n=1 Tax=Mycoplasmopsis agassizii TaxID=33922 RepID=UPI0035287B38
MIKIKIRKWKSFYQIVPGFYRLNIDRKDDEIYAKYGTLELMSKDLDLTRFSWLIYTNGDKDFFDFNTLQKINNFKFQITNEILKNLDELNHEDKVTKNVTIIWDKTAIKLISAGILPFANLEYFDDLLILEQSLNPNVYEIKIKFRKKGFEIFEINETPGNMFSL